ncbi:zinc finger protein 41-like [Trichoplusia ni]|uniref:Zinc finger protein 41-like n=1 Tax=Trichoplusia ni TaxID=7111 RepID=A0A7E5X466_TRINI|nr:zinc finger protein 41-like [Trichoplusia ni]
MNTEDINLCCGCLSSGRKMIKIVEFWTKQSFLQIINEISVSQAEPPVSLCWECAAQIHRFTKFKLKVKDSYTIFKEYIKKNQKIKLQAKSSLTTHKLHTINITQAEDTEESIFQIIKQEEEYKTPEVPVKEEYDHTFDSEDEKVQKKIKVKRRKRKRKEAEVYKEVDLSREDLEEERRIAMLKEEYVNAMFKCERCIVSFPNAEDLKDHINLKHELNASNLKCSVCECSFASEVSYNYHTNKHRRRYQCAICSDRHTSKRAVMRHYETAHFHGPSIEIDVQNNQQNGVNDEEGSEQNSTKQPLATFACEFCDKSFRWKASLRKHVETHRIETGQKRKPYCEPCRLSFTNTSNLQKHVKTSSKHQIQLKLRKLTESLPEDASTPEKHQQRIEQIKCSVNSAKEKFPCPQCDKKFQWRGNLLRHLNSHVARANGELVCEPCNRTFSSIATYKQHMKISRKHVSENDFKYMCSDCGKRFANKTRLKDHVDWEHLKNYVHTCSVCQKVFKSHTSLYLHKQVVHKKDNAEHLCDHCGKPFPNQAKLRCHMQALHSGSSAYKCGTCGARFSWLSCLSRHCKKLHPNVPPATE